MYNKIIELIKEMIQVNNLYVQIFMIILNSKFLKFLNHLLIVNNYNFLLNKLVNKIKSFSLNIIRFIYRIHEYQHRLDSDINHLIKKK